MQYAGSELSFNFPSAADCKNIFLRINIQQFFRRKQCNPKGKKILFYSLSQSHHTDSPSYKLQVGSLQNQILSANKQAAHLRSSLSALLLCPKRSQVPFYKFIPFLHPDQLLSPAHLFPAFLGFFSY